MSTLELLFENEIPAGRQALQDSHHNLQDVANYCEDNYVKAADKRRALEETKNFTTQSLASVAYQINTLATSMLQMLDLQATQMANMESSINHIAQNVAIHKEKVARREIGVLTTNKNCQRTHKVVVPANPEKQTKYKSITIDYSALDDVGHGLKLSSPSTTSGRSRTESQGSTSTSNSGGGGGYGELPIYQPKIEDPYNSMRRRMPNHPPVAPTVPAQYMSIGRVGMRDSQHGAPTRDRPGLPAYMQGQGQQPSQGAPMGAPAPPPPPPEMMGGGGMHMGMAQEAPPPPPSNMGPPLPGMGPPSHQMGGPPAHQMGGLPPSHQMGGPPAPPAPPIMGMGPPAHTQVPVAPPPPQQTQQLPPMNFNSQLNQAIMRGPSGEPQQRGSTIAPYGEIGMPPPPQDTGADLPPPPVDIGQYQSESTIMPPPPEFEAALGGDSRPADYIEQVVAVYDYVADREDELSFEEGSIIFVLKKNEDGWYEGVCNGQTGLFPGNYVELCP